MIVNTNIGIVSYGAYIPRSIILADQIEKAQGKEKSGIPTSLGVTQKTVPAIDEDTTTLATAAAYQALSRWDKNKESVQALFIGSESHPYAVKPTGSMVKQALGLPEQLATADLQFACKAGTQALQIISSYVSSNFIEHGIAIGADTAQSRPGDVLEFTAAAGAAAFIIGKKNMLAKLIATSSITTDTPDFWRRPGQLHPQHAGRFSGEPAYFYHVTKATQQLLKEANLKPADIDWCVFHTPNAKFPQAVAHQLGFTPQQIQHSLVVKQIGNTYAAASLLALASVLDHAQANQKILVTSYGSGAGSDSFLLETTQHLPRIRLNWSNLLEQQIQHTHPISYERYRHNTEYLH